MNRLLGKTGNLSKDAAKSIAKGAAGVIGNAMAVAGTPTGNDSSSSSKVNLLLSFL